MSSDQPPLDAFGDESADRADEAASTDGALPVPVETESESTSRLEDVRAAGAEVATWTRETSAALAAEYGPRIRAALRDIEDWLDEHYADADERRRRFYQGLVALALVVAWAFGKPEPYGWVGVAAVTVTVGPFIWFAEESEMWARLYELTALIAATVLGAIIAKATLAPWRSTEAFLTDSVVGRLFGVTFGAAIDAALALFGTAALFWLLKAYEYRQTSPEERVLAEDGGAE